MLCAERVRHSMPLRKAFLAWCCSVAMLLGSSLALAINVAEKRDETPVVGSPGVADLRQHGERIYESTCKACHGANVARAPSPYLLSIMPPAAIIRALGTGAMRVQGATLSDNDRNAVAYFLTGREAVEDPTLIPPACAGPAAKFDFRQPPPFASWGLQSENTRFIDNDTAGLSPANLHKLKLKWAVGFDGGTTIRSQPAIAGGAIFAGGDNGRLYSLDRHTGCARWTFQASAAVRTGIVVSPWQTGDATARPIVYFGDAGGTVHAIDAVDGSEVWRDRADSHPSTVLSAAPVLLGDRLFVPVSSMEEAAADGHYDCCTFRGSIVAYDARTGRRIWQSYLIDEPRVLGKYSSGFRHHGPSGAAVWNSPAIDAADRVLYFGTGDNYSTPATGTSDSIVAMELDTGKIRWVNQVTPGDIWNVSCTLPGNISCPDPESPDFDFGAGVIVASTSAGRKLVLSGQKSGWVYAMDPQDGSVEWKTRVGRGGVLGGILFGMSVNGDRVYVPISDVEDGKVHDIAARPGLFALDLESGSVLWSAPNASDACEGRPPQCSPGIVAPPVATDDLVLSGGNDGRVRIHAVSTGALLWQFDTIQEFPTVGGGKARGGSIGGAGPIVYDGMLIVGSGNGFGERIPGNVLLVFDSR